MLALLFPVISTNDGGYISICCKQCEKEYGTITYENEWQYPGDLIVSKNGYCDKCADKGKFVRDYGLPGNGPMGSKSEVYIKCSQMNCDAIYGTTTWGIWNKRTCKYFVGYCENCAFNDEHDVKQERLINSRKIQPMMVVDGESTLLLNESTLLLNNRVKKTDYIILYQICIDGAMNEKKFHDIHNVMPSMDCIKSYNFRKLEQDPIELKKFVEGTTYQRIDDCVYIYQHKQFWKIKLNDSQNTIGYIKTSSFDFSHKPATSRCDKILNCCCISFVIKLFTFLLSYTMIYSIVMDIILMSNIYYSENYKFFVWA
eukprot:467650_1